VRTNGTRRFWQKISIVTALTMFVALSAAVIPVLARDGSAASSGDASGIGGSSSPSAHFTPAIVNLPNAKSGEGTWLVGSGFAPNRPLNVRIAGGIRYLPGEYVDTDITYLMSPVPETNVDGAFASAFGLASRYWQRGMISDRPMTVRIVDEETNELLATAPLTLCDANAEAIDQSAWCVAASDAVATGY
jgi:hypothetical protein